MHWSHLKLSIIWKRIGTRVTIGAHKLDISKVQIKLIGWRKSCWNLDLRHNEFGEFLCVLNPWNNLSSSIIIWVVWLSRGGVFVGEIHYLCTYLLRVEGLSALIRQTKSRGDLHGIQICVNAPVVFHLLFVDDCFLFFRGTESEAHIMTNILTTYEAASGQAISLQKFEIHYSIQIDQPTRTSITQILGIQEVYGTRNIFGSSIYDWKKQASNIWVY
jgi:hypothetical protein